MSEIVATAPSDACRGGRLAPRLAIAAATAALLCALVRLAAYARWAIGHPWGLDYGEGVVWQQMSNIVAGHGYERLRLLPAFVYEFTLRLPAEET